MAFDKNTLSFISPLISTQEILQSLMLNSGFSFWLDAGNMNRCLNWFPQAPEQTVMNSYDWNRETRTDSYDWNRETRKLNIRSKLHAWRMTLKIKNVSQFATHRYQTLNKSSLQSKLRT